MRDNEPMDDVTTAIAERYRRFATEEAPGRSELYEEWAWGVAGDLALQQVIARIPPQRRQPALVFAVTRMLGSGETGAAPWSAWVLAHADAVVAECARRAVQTNEPLRCAALLPALSLIDGPIALLEVGASAGLCLYPDRYSYRYRDAAGQQLRLDPPEGASPVELTCEVRGQRMPRLRLPEVVWRAGIDVNPLPPTDPDTRSWLTRLVWPGETGRAERISAALEIAAADPPLLVAGDATAMLASVAAEAPAGVTLVVTTPGVLAHIPWAGRHEVIAAARTAGRWITIDEPGLHSGWNAAVDPQQWPAGGFAVALDGDIVAAADPLGGWIVVPPL